MWRPEGWPEICYKTQNEVAAKWEGADGGTILEYGIEAGADAMLEALIAKGIKIDTSAPGMYIEYVEPTEGWVIIIPEG